MNALTKAWADASRSLHAAKAAVADMREELLARGPSGLPFGQPLGLDNAKQQLDAFRSWVFAAVRPICNRIAAQEVKVGRVRSSGRKLATKAAADVQALDTHPILDLIHDPNDLQTGWGLVWGTVASINLCGKAYWWVPDGNENIYLIPCSWIGGFTGTTRFQSWKVLPPGRGEPIDLPSERVVYFALPSPADPWGSVSPLQTAAAAVNNDDDILKSQRSAFGRGLNPLHAIVVGKDQTGLRRHLTAVQQRQLVAAVRKRYSGTSQHGEPFIVDGLIEDIKRLTDKPSEMDWLESAKMMKQRILEAFGTSPYILGSSEPGSRAASAVAEQHFISSTLNPLIHMMSEALTEWMGPMFAGEGERLKVWIEPCVADDAEMAHKWATLLAQNGGLTVHELRRLAPFGLAEDGAFDGQLVGGRNLSTTNPIEAGITAMVQDAMAGLEADRLLEHVERGNGQLVTRGSPR